MATVTIEPRYWSAVIHNPDDATIRRFLLDSHENEHWGDAIVSFDDGAVSIKMIILSDSSLGYYFKYLGEDEYLSVGDPNRLSEVVCPDDLFASAGLFIPAQRALTVLCDFCATGGRSTSIRWIKPGDMPSDGNW